MENKNRKKSKRRKIGFWLFVFIVFLLFLVTVHKQRLQNLFVKPEGPSVWEIISQYKHVTFSDSFFSDAWLDMGKTTLELNIEKQQIILSQDKEIAGSLAENNKEKEEVKQVVSKKFNSNVRNIIAAQIIRSEYNSEVNYYFSNNGGKSWQPTEIGKPVLFKQKGNDLRWRAEINPKAKDLNNFYINNIFIKYWYER